jgi:hypothetical protein
VYYTCSDCTGTAYLYQPGDWPTVAGSWYVQSGVLFYPRPGTQQTLTINSENQNLGGGCVTTPNPETFPMSQIESVSLSGQFVPPLTIQAN